MDEPDKSVKEAGGYGKYGVPAKLPDGRANPEYVRLWNRDHGVKPRGEALRGKPFSEEHKTSLSLAWDVRRERGVSEETRQKLSASHKGRKFSEERNLKISLTKQKKRAERDKLPYYCRICGELLAIGTNWIASQAPPNKPNQICDTCRKRDSRKRSSEFRKTPEGMQYVTTYKEAHKEDISEYHKGHLEELWNEAFSRYGNKCADCGETNRFFLTLDHKDNDGNEEKRKYGYIGIHLAKKLGWPTNLQILCWNCQAAKAIRLAREQSLMLHPIPPNAKYWSSGPKIGYCQVCRIELTSFTASAVIVNKKYGMCHNCRKAYEREQRDSYKKQFVDHFGGKCYCCGENRIDRLTQGHINNDGAEHRRNGGDTSTNEYRSLVKSGFKTDYPRRVECFNCNDGAARNGGICPHTSS